MIGLTLEPFEISSWNLYGSNEQEMVKSSDELMKMAAFRFTAARSL